MTTAAPRTGALLVAIDFEQPQSYLAKGPTSRLAASLGIAIDWQPMVARPIAEPTDETEGESRGARHRRMRARYFEYDLRRYAEAQGLVLGEVHRAGDSSVAGIGLLWVKRHASGAMGLAAVDAYVNRVFDGYWRGALALDDVDAIRGLMDRIGLTGSAFDPAALHDEYERSLERWRVAGMIEAPAYLVGDEVFIGRAHLPMVEWLLRGKDGPPPV